MSKPQPPISIDDSGFLISGGALDLIRLPGGGVERYHVDLLGGNRFRLALVAIGRVSVTVNRAEPRVDQPVSDACVEDVDAYHVTLHAHRPVSIVITVENPSRKPVTAAIALQTRSGPVATPRLAKRAVAKPARSARR